MDKRISVRLDAELARNLHAAARQRTMTAIINEALRNEWKRYFKAKH